EIRLLRQNQGAAAYVLRDQESRRRPLPSTRLARITDTSTVRACRSRYDRALPGWPRAALGGRRERLVCLLWVYFCLRHILRMPQVLEFMVGVAGFEPATFCTPCRRATKLRHTPSVANDNRVAPRRVPAWAIFSTASSRPRTRARPAGPSQ